MGDPRAERLIVPAIVAVWLGVAIPAYFKLAAAVVRVRGELSPSGHLAVALVAALVVPLALAAGLALAGAGLVALGRLAERSWRVIRGYARGPGTSPGGDVPGSRPRGFLRTPAPNAGGERDGSAGGEPVDV